MSIKSGRSRSSATNSILRKTSSIRSRLSDSSKQKPVKVRFTLPHSKKVRSILQDFVEKENGKEYETLVCLIRDAELSDDELSALLEEATACVSLLGKELRFFIEALFLTKWLNRGDEVITKYKTFLINLVSAHNYHVKLVVDHLVTSFFLDFEEVEWPDGIPTDVDCKKCVNIHSVLSVMLNIIPMCQELLIKSVTSNYPYFKKPAHLHELYLHNLLWILDYQPKFKLEILQLIFSKLIILDVNTPQALIIKTEYGDEDEEMFMMDDIDNSRLAQNPNSMKHPTVHILDICMDKMLSYITMECHDQAGQLNWDRMKDVYKIMITIFDKVILPTYNINHVQFVMFIMCCFKPTITEAFLNFLWKKVLTPNVPAVHQQSAVAYIASLVARGLFVPLSMVKGTLQQMANWISSYIVEQDGLDSVNLDLRMHLVFYSVCQALFYVIAFRHKDLTSTKKNMVFLESLNLTKIVTCKLNPLRVCQPVVVQKFAAVARIYQLAYCYSIIEHNTRNILPTVYTDEKGSVIVSNNYVDSFFPFDPYMLKRSGQKITQFYRDYEEQSLEDVLPEKRDSCEVDDFLNEPSSSFTDKFSYRTSPGFIQKN